MTSPPPPYTLRASALRNWLRQLSFRDMFVLVLPALLIVGAGFWFAARYIKPAPPDFTTFSCGAEGSAYETYCARYKPLIEPFGVRVDVRQSAGSIENLQRLMDTEQSVDFAFVQGGSAEDHPPGLLSLGAAYYEPVWVFYRGRPGLDRLDQLKGLRIGVGAEGSGTRHLALQLLEAHALVGDAKLLKPLGGTAGVVALLSRKIDALIVVGAVNSASVWSLLYADGISLMSMAQSPAYARRFPHLSEVTLPRGAIDFVRDIPSRDISMVATRAYVVAREDTHPALIDLMLGAMKPAHAEATVFQHPGEFPQSDGGDFELHPRAARFYEVGPPFLQRYLPFSIANLLDRMIVLLVPLLALAVPLFRILPQLYVWRVRSKLYRWYGELKDLERQALQEDTTRSRAEWLHDLDRIEIAVARIGVPLSHADYHYQLRAHIHMVRRRLQGLAENVVPADLSTSGVAAGDPAAPRV
ncbi:tRAP transporter solute receptor, TAXI family [Methyloversatilis sp. RAC08]|uniref:TAXI family TRAP transporter solute-binding subunit n=1 Tax=Methyloversatilis sp. RAC08 TaxID=1842540 RepID=UPI00083E333D|nr:TAXI family TRAP transporter solute-binding subunit [Methyloversatilis sp. RAC08]AOF81909.1 tRAP transporter solute receptor, TAXI family [Methyloversatilis sp. RAC08]